MTLSSQSHWKYSQASRPNQTPRTALQMLEISVPNSAQLMQTCDNRKTYAIPGVQEAVVICLNKTREAEDQSLCVSSRRPPQLLQDCNTQLCPPRIGLLPTGSLRIQSPNKEDEGLYTCTARNHLGSTSLSSLLHITDGKGRNCDQGNNMGVNSPHYPERTNSSQSAELCCGQDCPFRCRVDSWAPCSATCEGGSQTRRVRCMKGPEDSLREVDSQHCLGTGRRPSDTSAHQ
ncbi:hypothetical protein PAMP_009777 [Pampus punctatissimus]